MNFGSSFNSTNMGSSKGNSQKSAFDLDQTLKPPTQSGETQSIFKSIVIEPKNSPFKAKINNWAQIEAENKEHERLRDEVFSNSRNSSRSCSRASDKVQQSMRKIKTSMKQIDDMQDNWRTANASLNKVCDQSLQKVLDK